MPASGCRITPAGAKAWIFAYRNNAGIKRRLTLGKVEKLSATAARKLAEAARTEVRNGGDPQLSKQKKAAAAKLSEAVERYLEARQRR